jgi:poly-gamma-glutamate capsule biosynthesis protein CapA/YwtB (metallophosphatase superfamily)
MSAPSLVFWESPNREPVVANIAVAGDFLPAGKLEFPAKQDWTGMASKLAPCFDDIAISFANLECPLDVEGLRARPLCGLGQIVSAPSESLDYIAAIRAKIISISNNHIYDFGDEGIEQTRRAVTRREMVPVGAGHTLGNAPETYIWPGPNNIRVGFWAAAKAASDFARRGSPGVEPATIERAAQALSELKSRRAQFCIALLHAGVIRTNRPDPEDVALLDSFAKIGFQLTLASHSHRISGSKIVSADKDQPAFCFYGLGSLVSGYVAHPLEREGLAVVAGLNAHGNLFRLEVRPIWLNETGFGEVPTQEMSETILDRFQALSQEIADHSYERLFYQDVSRGLLRLYARDARSAFRQSGLRGIARKAARVRMRHIRRLIHKVVS